MFRNLGHGFLLASVQAPKLAAPGRKSQNVQCTQFAWTFFSIKLSEVTAATTFAREAPLCYPIASIKSWGANDTHIAMRIIAFSIHIARMMGSGRMSACGPQRRFFASYTFVLI